MNANPDFSGRSDSFWGYLRFTSQHLGYSKKNVVLKHSSTKIMAMLKRAGIAYDTNVIEDVSNYISYRANLLNDTIESSLMNVTEAREMFNELMAVHQLGNYSCKLPMNKQRGTKKDKAFFTCIINILTERTLRQYAIDNNLAYGKDIFFNDDPMTLTCFKDSNGHLAGVMSRRFDGAFPGTVNPLAIWEIKEYYYTTTFGSRIADGVYETQLDGFELNSLESNIGHSVKHVYFIDDYNTWWRMGKSYLCRIVDMLNMGLVDEVIFGKEVFERWPAFMNEILNSSPFQ